MTLALCSNAGLACTSVGTGPARATTATPTPGPRRTLGPGERVSLRARDGMRLNAELRLPVSPTTANPPVLLLLHDLAGDLAQWDEVLPLFHGAGWATLALDIRGHGRSTAREDGAEVTFERLGPLGVAAMPLDPWAALDWLRESPRLDARRVAVVGAGLGGNLAWVCSGTEWGVHNAIALSPLVRLSKAGEEIAGLAPTGVLIVAGDRDPGAAASARYYAARSAGAHRVLIVKGTSGHGTDLLRGPTAGVVGPQVVEWIRERFEALP